MFTSNINRKRVIRNKKETMTSKEKAIELVNKMFAPPNCVIINRRQFGKTFLAKQCALIAVDEILNNNCGSYTDESNATNNEIYCDEYYWQEVKTEIEKL
jgi:hypothetical protein